MHPESNIVNPTFITKFLHVDQRFAEEFSNLTASLLPANIALWKEPQTLTDSVRDGCGTFLIDPVTHSFTYLGYLDKTTYRDLPYAPPQPISATDLLSQPNLITEFTRNVLEFQRDMRTGAIIAPYFYTRDIDDSRLVANLRMVSEAANIRQDMNLEIPLYAWVCIGAIVMQSPAQVNEIANLYCDLPVEGFMLTIENFDDRSVSAEALMGLSRLTRRLKEDRDVFICSIASFGQVLTALGANGFSAGIGWLETFREVTLQPGRPSFAADRVPRSQYYYVPELLSYIHPNDVVTIFDDEAGSTVMREGYMCNCNACINGIPDSVEDKKRHFMIRRQEEMDSLSNTTIDERPHFMRDRLQLALELANIIEEEALVRVQTEHFVRWIAIIDALSSASSVPENNETQPDINDIVHQSRQ